METSTSSEVFISENAVPINDVDRALDSLTISSEKEETKDTVRKQPPPEAVLMDFSNTFKAGTRGFKKKVTKKAPTTDHIETT